MTITDLNDMLLQYNGNVDTGVVFKLFPDRDIGDFTIFHQPPDGFTGYYRFFVPTNR
jgi:hypothetical protein